MGDTFGKALKLAGEKVDPSYRRWVKMSQARDYRDLTCIGVGGTEGLMPVPGGGEFKHVTIGKVGETFRLAKHGAIFTLTREALINDDLDALKSLY